MSCLDNLCSIGLCDEVNESGFKLLEADGITIKNLANVAPDSTGIQLANEKKALSIRQIQNDFIAYLHANRVVTSLSNIVHSSASFITSQNNGLYDGYRGQTLYRTNQRGGLRKLIIPSIDLYPLEDGIATLKIDDGLNVYTLPDIELTGGQVNILDNDLSDIFPFIAKGSQIQVTIDQSEVLFSKSTNICHLGCGGQIPNDCGWIDGWTGTGATKDEGYGMNINFYCECDYSEILCNFSKNYMGELVWLKWQINIFKEHANSNRFDNWVVYKGQDIIDRVLPGLENEYASKWNALMDGIFNVIKSYNDGCLNCRGIRTAIVI